MLFMLLGGVLKYAYGDSKSFLKFQQHYIQHLRLEQTHALFEPNFSSCSDSNRSTFMHSKYFSCYFFFCQCFCFRYVCKNTFLESQTILHVFVFFIDSCRGRCHCTVSYFFTSPRWGFWQRLLGQRAKGDDNPAYIWPSASIEFMGNQPPVAGITVTWDSKND